MGSILQRFLGYDVALPPTNPPDIVFMVSLNEGLSLKGLFSFGVGSSFLSLLPLSSL